MTAKPTQDKTPFERFTDLARKVIAVPKKELTAREKKWEKARAKKKRSA